MNCGFSTTLKTAMRNRDEWHIDNGKKIRTKKYSNADLARELNYSINVINGWTKTNGDIPSYERMKEIAKILNVDVAYLIGEQTCQRNVDETICNVTKLNEPSAKLLAGLEGIKADTMNELLNHNDFERLILLIWRYTHSHNYEITIKNTLDDSKEPPYFKDAQREIIKYSATDAFGKILDDIYDAHKQTAIDVKVASIFKELKNNIIRYIEFKDEDEARCLLLKMVSSYQNKIKQLRPDDTICKLSPEWIIDNFNTIEEYL